MQKIIDQVLSQYGLSDNEIVIYLESLKHKEASPFQLSKLTGVPRTTVYDVLMSLSLKGLVELNQSDGISKQQTRIKAKNPSVLRTLIRNRRKDLTALEVNLVEILPILKGSYHQDEPDANFMFYPGIDGAKKVLFSEDEDGLDIDLLVFENMMPMDAFGTGEINQDVDKYLTHRQHKSGRAKELTQLNDWSKHVISYQYERDPGYISLRDIRYIDNQMLNINLRLVVKGERILISCAHEEEVWGLVVKSQALSTTIASVFNVLWHQAVPVTKEVVESWGSNEYREQELGKRD